MDFVKAKLVKINADGHEDGSGASMIGKTLKIGTDILSDVVLSDNYESVLHCEIIEDTLGKVCTHNLKNYLLHMVMLCLVANPHPHKAFLLRKESYCYMLFVSMCANKK